LISPSVFYDHLAEILVRVATLGGLAVAGIADAVEGPSGLPGAEYIGMFGVVWLLFKNLDKREDGENQRRKEETAVLEALHQTIRDTHDAMRENTVEIRRLHALMERSTAATETVIDEMTGPDGHTHDRE